MRKGDLIILIASYDAVHSWPASGIIIEERSLHSWHPAAERFNEINPFVLDVLWNDGVITLGVDASWLARHYFIP